MTPSTLVTDTGPVADEHACSHRIRRLRDRMDDTGLAAVVLTAPENVYYLTGLDHLGYFAFTALVVPALGEPVVVTRAMERPTVRTQVPWCRHAVFADGEPPARAVAEVLADASGPGDSVGWDAASMYFPPAVAHGLRAALPRRRWRDASDLLAHQRAVKSPAEVERVRRAAAVSDDALAAGLAALRPGVAEREVAAEVYRAMIAAGGRPPGFPPLIRSTAVLDHEHVSWSDGTLSTGQGVFFELSGSVDRYHAPLSRTVYIGRAPEGAEVAAGAALAGLTAVCRALRPGARTGQVYAAWRRAVAGHAPADRHHCGYLVGIGFPPSWVGGGEVLGIRPGGDMPVRTGMTFHLMSWVTRPVGHVVSDTALVTRSGAELLTATERRLLVR